MKPYEEVGTKLHAFLTSVLDEGERPLSLSPRVKNI
jgi:hypothetical protein